MLRVWQFSMGYERFIQRRLQQAYVFRNLCPALRSKRYVFHKVL